MSSELKKRIEVHHEGIESCLLANNRLGAEARITRLFKYYSSMLPHEEDLCDEAVKYLFDSLLTDYHRFKIEVSPSRRPYLFSIVKPYVGDDSDT